MTRGIILGDLTMTLGTVRGGLMIHGTVRGLIPALIIPAMVPEELMFPAHP